jgi:hypothetical protein
MKKYKQKIKQFAFKKGFFLTIDLVEDLLDLLLAPITVDIHFQHACLGTDRNKMLAKGQEETCTAR